MYSLAPQKTLKFFIIVLLLACLSLFAGPFLFFSAQMNEWKIAEDSFSGYDFLKGSKQFGDSSHYITVNMNDIGINTSGVIVVFSFLIIILVFSIFSLYQNHIYSSKAAKVFVLVILLFFTLITAILMFSLDKLIGVSFDEGIVKVTDDITFSGSFSHGWAPGFIGGLLILNSVLLFITIIVTGAYKGYLISSPLPRTKPVDYETKQIDDSNELGEPKKSTYESNKSGFNDTQKGKDDNLIIALQKLKELKDKGLISEEEYAMSKKEILHNYTSKMKS